MRLWRYMDLPKFRKLVQQKALYFCGARNFDDPFEGEYAWGKQGHNRFLKAQAELCQTHGSSMPLEMFIALNLKNLKDIAQKTYINCWHRSAHESEAMWKLYCENPAEGVVVCSSIEKLRVQLGRHELPNLQLKPVRYLRDFWIKNYNPEPDVFISKRVAFEHEREFRAVFQDRDAPINLEPIVHGKLVDVNISELVSEVRLSPFASTDFAAEVDQVISDSGLDLRVGPSEIETHPILAVEEQVMARGDNWYQSSMRLRSRDA